MHDGKSYKVYYQRIPLNFWFYFWVGMSMIMVVLIIIRIVWLLSGSKDQNEGWLGSIVYLFITYSVAERCYKQYSNSKINQCYIEIDEDGINWRLPEASYKVKEKEVIAWQDMKKVIVSENGITIRYMSTYFTDTIPFAKICEEDRDALLAFLRKQLLERSIVFEDQLAA